jgi:hypothetical protein
MNAIYLSIAAFAVLLFLLHLVKPSMIYAKDGSIRQFGIGYRQKTVVPLWFVVLLVAAVCYAVAYNFA